jgi:hypothetical protein
LWILSLPAYTVLLITLVLLWTERLALGLESDIPFYVAIGLVYFALCLWWASLVCTIFQVACYLLLRKQGDLAPITRHWASMIALTTTMAFAASYKTLPLVIPVP